jgi:hypothetical protein
MQLDRHCSGKHSFNWCGYHLCAGWETCALLLPANQPVLPNGQMGWPSRLANEGSNEHAKMNMPVGWNMSTQHRCGLPWKRQNVAHAAILPLAMPLLIDC